VRSINLLDKVNSLSAKYNFRPSFVLDQNFMIDAGAIEREIRYGQLEFSDAVLEIGPGLGFLTEQLARKVQKVIAVEKDKRLQTLLTSELSGYGNIEYIWQDVLEAKLPKFNKIVSNIPYSISAPLTFSLLDYEFDLAVICYQKEFAEKMVCEPGSNDYGRLSVMVQYYFEPKLLEVVPKNAFYPQPKVDSAIVSLVRKPIKREPDFDVFIRELFRYPSKDVHNAVKFGLNKEIEDSRKMFTLDIPELRKLYEKLK
jgi:16S rRNA (adenine1518-N6/adenine1519-N6)-dimethyltransferase